MIIAFINPPHADWSLANNFTFLLMQSYYSRFGKYSKKVKWLESPYKWNSYKSYDEVIDDIIEADIIMFSSYTWNYMICDEISNKIKNKYPEKILVLGGPHIGTNEPELLTSRPQYDLICRPTKPGEPFMAELIDQFIENRIDPTSIPWELRSDVKLIHDLSKEDYSVYEDHLEYLTKLLKYARNNKMEPFIVLETTRGCPYKCVFCEWGGGINTKIYKKSLGIVKRDINAMLKAGYRSAYLNDANFGAFFERDFEIFEYAWTNGFNLTDISTMKSKDLNRRKKLIDKYFEIVGTNYTSPNMKNGKDMWSEMANISIVPSVSIQSSSDIAMKIAERVDLNTEDKLELSKHINEQCSKHGFPIPNLEMILAMPGSTIDDFYNEMEYIWNFKSFGSYRHDYMFLPDSALNSQEYKIKYDIRTVEVYTDIADEQGIDSWNNLYKNKKSYFKTISSCFSFTTEEMHEMWFMNSAGNYLLQHFYPMLENSLSPSVFTKKAYEVISKLDRWDDIHSEIRDIFNPNSQPKSIKVLNQEFRANTINKFIEKNRHIIMSEVSKECL
tara:strand:+ start:29370 stop:31040 length:1671 start_codon:yes stop_codon:yes gene_type:complete